MQSRSDIKMRIKAVTDTRQITKAMETISIAKMRKASVKYKSNTEFFKKIRSTISDIVLHTNAIEHRYLNARAGKRALFIVVASDKGLCGGYNNNVLQLAFDKIKKYPDSSVFTVGQMAREFFTYRKINVDVEFIHVSSFHSMRDAMKISESVLNLYDQDLVDEVHIVFTALDAQNNSKAQAIQLLPMSREKIVDQQKELSVEQEYYYRELEYDPSPEDVLNELIPQYLTGVIYGALVQSSAAEHSSRRMAMSNATQNATEIIDNLSLVYNRVRQASVTNEISEIITSSMAVK